MGHNFNMELHLIGNDYLFTGIDLGLIGLFRWFNCVVNNVYIRYLLSRRHCNGTSPPY
jgi:hypothetical protein